MQTGSDSRTSRCVRGDPAVAQCGRGERFDTTHWSVVLMAGRDSSADAHAALERLCRAYWYPLYIFVRRRGFEPHEAQDLTQSFFARLIEKNYLSAVDRSKGKFRSFLLAALEHFLAKEWRRAHAQKRGGGVSFIPLDPDSTEQSPLQLPALGLSPEEAYERQWATTLLGQVLARLRAEFLRAGKEASFEDLKHFLTRENRPGTYAAVAEKLGTTEAALKMAVSRMKRRYGELLREEIAQTVSRPEEVEEELRALFAAVSR